ncbi:MAG: OsmC family protein [Gemmatimonadaceae bacterium]
MKVTVTAEESLRVELTGEALTIEAPTADLHYSPFHMLANALGACSLFVLQSWASNKGVSVEGPKIDVSWTFVESEHRVGFMEVKLHWPALPAELWPRAIRAANLCGIHKTLTNPPTILVVAPDAQSPAIEAPA